MNVLFILADDLGWGDVGFHGAPIQTPTLNRMARQGAELTHHYVCPACTPSRACFITGMYASRFGRHATLPTSKPVIPDGFSTIARMFQEAGYDTGLFGKWHLGSAAEFFPGKYGFDESYGSLAGGVDPYTHRYKIGPYSLCWHRNGALLDEPGHATDLITEEAIRWISQRKNKWFCYVPFTAVHTPIRATEQWLNLYEAETLDDDPERNRSFREYAAYTTQMDDAVGRLIETLKCLDVLSETVVVFASDNGAPVSDAYEDTALYPGRYPRMPRTGTNHPLKGRKGQLYEGGIRTPGIVLYPGFAQGRPIDTDIHIADWLPTFAAMIGAKAPQTDGVNMLGALLGEGETPGRSLYWNMDHASFAVKRDGWKLTVNADRKSGREELYNLDADPLEQEDCLEKYPDRAAELRKLINAWRKDDDCFLRPDA